MGAHLKGTLGLILILTLNLDLLRDTTLLPGKNRLLMLMANGLNLQPGSFYGGWMTSEIVGPVKGEPGSGGW